MGTAGGHQNQRESKGNGSRGRPYGLMLLVAFGAALLGVMVLHKFRERRICNLLLKQRDQDLLSLHLLFQKQIDHNKELEKNHQDMKSKVYSLRTQKMELDRRLLEMQSTIDSLRDEQKTIGVALQEKQNEIKMLREKEIESRKENPQVVVLTESLKEKEAELEDLRHQLEESEVKVRSVATDDPSNQHVHSTSEERNEPLLESSSYEVGEDGGVDNRRVEIKTQNSAEEGERREMTGEQMLKQESLEDEGKEKEVTDGDVREFDNKESEITKDHKEKEVKDSRDIVNQKSHGVLKSGKKREIGTGKYGTTRKIKGKRWKYIARQRRLDNGWRLISKTMKQEKNRNLDNSGVINMRNRKFFTVGASNEGQIKGEYPLEATNSLESSSLEHHLEKIVEDEKGNQMEKEGEILMKPKELHSTESDIMSEDGEEKQEDEGQPEHPEVGDSSIEQNPGKGVEPKDHKTEEKQEPERDAENQFNGETSTEIEEGKEEYKEEMDESEF